MAHPKVVLFLTHCGMHGVLEAVWNSVPMVGMPVFIDQVGTTVDNVTSEFGIIFLLISSMWVPKLPRGAPPRFSASGQKPTTSTTPSWKSETTRSKLVTNHSHD